MNAAEDELAVLWWAATAEERLLLQRCARCGYLHHPPRAMCTSCGLLLIDSDHDYVEASGRGVVDAYTVVHRAPAPGVETPFTVARVRLAEGPILLTWLVGVSDPACDLPVRLAWRRLPDGRNLPVFTSTREE
ncbi:Zn-ribbon domain-containing OB-fold protein [Hamadaea sp. NPDC051192]|uniref:Zn-ribbon domain-containing OB-fold protein n=1 Tax=Hamadaea sp. NPDC051192 TaxID=3154940 RepID=UPI00344A001E